MHIYTHRPNALTLTDIHTRARACIYYIFKQTRITGAHIHRRECSRDERGVPGIEFKRALLCA